MTASSRPLLGEILADARLIGPAQLEEARALQDQLSLRLGQALIQLGHASEDDIAWALSRQLRLPYVHLTPDMVHPAAMARVPVEVMERLGVLPVLVTDETISVVMRDPTDREAVAEVERTTGLRVEPAIGLARNIQDLLAHFRCTPPPLAELDPGLTALRFHLSAAAHAGATEVYFEPQREGVLTRYRTHSGLLEGRGPTASAQALAAAARALGAAVEEGATSRVHAQLPLTEGVMGISLSVIPTARGPAILGHIAPGPARPLPPDALGLDEAVVAVCDRLIGGSGVLLIGCPEPTFRRRCLRWLASIAASRSGTRVIGVGLGSGSLGPGVLAADLGHARDLLETSADLVFADVGTDAEQGAALIRARRPGQFLALGTSHLRAAWAVTDLARLVGVPCMASSLAAVLTGMPVPALCACARLHSEPPAGWPGTPCPTRWASPGGCGRCRYTGFHSQVFVGEWFHAAPDTSVAGAGGSLEALLSLAEQHLNPSLPDHARAVVERLQARPADASRILGESPWTSPSS